MAKVQKPAKHVDDQEVSSVTAVASTGADVTAKGLVKVTTASSGLLLLSNGEWNGQECLLVLDSGSDDLTIKNAANDAVIKGYSSWDVSAETVVLCKWFHDGTNGYWYGLAGAA
tara:strand:- start:201 stop:542 length:342 start_codon:yes stop_codon:yes gene_type:complete